MSYGESPAINSNPRFPYFMKKKKVEEIKFEKKNLIDVQRVMRTQQGHQFASGQQYQIPSVRKKGTKNLSGRKMFDKLPLPISKKTLLRKRAHTSERKKDRSKKNNAYLHASSNTGKN